MKSYKPPMKNCWHQMKSFKAPMKNLQSVNEELLTVNAEYQVKIQELTEINNDVSNLFNTTQVGTIFLDESLNIRKFTPNIRHEINLIDQDIGRPLSHISHNLKDIDLHKDADSGVEHLDCSGERGAK